DCLELVRLARALVLGRCGEVLPRREPPLDHALLGVALANRINNLLDFFVGDRAEIRRRLGRERPGKQRENQEPAGDAAFAGHVRQSQKYSTISFVAARGCPHAIQPCLPRVNSSRCSRISASDSAVTEVPVVEWSGSANLPC